MRKINAKLLTNNKIKADIIYYLEENFNIKNLFEYLQGICGELDIPVPLILTKHVKHLVRFNSVTFLPEDFVESFNYDKLIIEPFL